MKKVVVISALCMGGVGLMAFKPFKVHTVPLNDVTAAYNAGKFCKLATEPEFQESYTSGYTSDKGSWSEFHKGFLNTRKKSPDKIEKVLNKY